jgi:acyl-CoA hydrolase
MPYTFGDALLDEASVDMAVEVDAPLPSRDPQASDEASLAVAERVAARVGDGATLQMGIRAVPDAAIGGLTGRQGLGVWTEMFSDGLLTLERAGALDPDRPVTASFWFGSAELYEHCRPQPAHPDAAHREDEQPNAHRRQPGDDEHQHGP